MSTPDPATLHRIADLLDNDAVGDFVADVIADARDQAPRPRDLDGVPFDLDTAELIDILIERLRGAT